ncbi:S8 family serine peptidase [Virgisporangium aurantiacum]|nr:S8 family serine peptidase [Virgisporangium aurantiacum]
MGIMRLRAALIGLVVAAATGLLGAAPARADTSDTPDPAGMYVVVLRSTPSWASARALAERYGGRLEQAFQTALPGFSARMTAAAAGRLAADPAVESVQPDRQVRSTGTQVDPASWGLDRIDQASLPRNGAYTYPTTAGNVTAYVIDSGIRTTHTDFGGRATSGWDFVDNDADADDCAGHGTHVAGTIGGTSYGVAKGVNLVALRVLGCDGAGSYAGIIAAVDWVTANAHKPAVVNMSFSGTTYAPLNEAVAASIASGVTYVVSAGNDGADACGYSPAGVAAAVTVGATGQTDARAPFSNAGPCVDLFAPGVGITSAGIADDSASRSMNGTSMAAPHVAGAAALILADHPEATPAQVASALGAAARPGVVTDPAGAPGLLAQTAPSSCDVRTDGADVAIKDRGTVVSTIALAGCSGRATWVSVEVHIAHPRRGDLVVELIAPNGVVKRLKSSNRHDRAADVSATYPVTLSVKDRTGTWKLRVRDTTRAATGHIDSWTLTVA